MKQKNGIICLETEWEHTVEKNRRSIHSENFQNATASAYLCALVMKLHEQGYKIELTEEQIRNQIKTYRTFTGVS